MMDQEEWEKIEESVGKPQNFSLIHILKIESIDIPADLSKNLKLVKEVVYKNVKVTKQDIDDFE